MSLHAVRRSRVRADLPMAIDAPLFTARIEAVERVGQGDANPLPTNTHLANVSGLIGHGGTIEAMRTWASVDSA